MRARIHYVLPYTWACAFVCLKSCRVAWVEGEGGRVRTVSNKKQEATKFQKTGMIKTRNKEERELHVEDTVQQSRTGVCALPVVHVSMSCPSPSLAAGVRVGGTHIQTRLRA